LRHFDRNRGKTCGSRFVIAGLVPAISIRRARCVDDRDDRDKPGRGQGGTAAHFAPVYISTFVGACDMRRFSGFPVE